MTDADYAQMARGLLDQRDERRGPIRLFAYGSLIWKPEIAHDRECPALARGWHRSFCLRISRFRGTPEVPGLMMALDRGGQCRGLLLDLPPEDPEGQLDRILRRECTVKPTSNMPRWLRVETDQGPAQALGFVINRASPNYAGRMALAEVAEVLARACGHWGSGAEYLLNTVGGLEARGIRDGRLWQLQRLVAAAIDRADADPLPLPDRS
ncbi:MAG: gamma-glutamylcyclotransferase [Tabrizicola sp.]|nr:gamma-glutamylcyclotransferase [Tabrizicola sp.]